MDFIARIKDAPGNHLVGLFAMLMGMLFFLLQSSKLLRPSAAEVEMAELPFGRFDWGYVWADTLIAGPLLLLGGWLLWRSGLRAQRVGALFAFAGFAINTYAMVFFWVGLWAIGETLPGAWFGSVYWWDMVFVVLCGLSMIFLGSRFSR